MWKAVLPTELKLLNLLKKSWQYGGRASLMGDLLSFFYHVWLTFFFLLLLEGRLTIKFLWDHLMCFEWLAASGQNYNKAGISQGTRSIFKALAFGKTVAVSEDTFGNRRSSSWCYLMATRFSNHRKNQDWRNCNHRFTSAPENRKWTN